MYHFCFHGIHPFVCAGRYRGIALRKAGERLDLLREAFRGSLGTGEFLPGTERGRYPGGGS